MEIWLSKDKDRFRLPILPPNFEISVGNLNTVVNINELGDINLIGKSGLKALNLSTFFPDQQYYFVEYSGFPPPYKCKDKLENWRVSEDPIRLIITTTGINMLVSIENFNFGERDGTGDLYYSLDLKEYINPKVRTIAKVSEPKRPVPKKKKIPPSTEKTYVVKRGDSLWAIAKKFYGNGSQYTKIYNRNKKVIGSNPNLIYPGQKYKIP